MQITSHDNGALRPESTPGRPGIPPQRDERPAGTREVDVSSVRRDRVEISDNGGKLSDPAHGMTSQERLDAWAGKFLARLDGLMRKEGMNREQLAALQEAKADFLANVDRFSDAFFGGGANRNGIGDALSGVVGELRAAVRAALDQPSPGGASPDSTTLG